MAENNTTGGTNPRSHSIKKSIMKRVRVLYFVFAFLAVAVFAMILLTQYGPNGTPLRNRSDLKCYRTIPTAASRGNIYARDGRILATDSPSYNITLDFTVFFAREEEQEKIRARNETAEERTMREQRAREREAGLEKEFAALADSLNKTIPGYSKDYFFRRLKDIRAKARQGGPGSQNQQLIREKVNQLQLDRMKTFPVFKNGRLGGGFIYTQDPERYRPFGTLAARTIGRPEGAEGARGFGLEESFNDVLAGHSGRNLCVRLVRDVWVPVVDKSNVEAVNGRDIVTTIDINMQDIAESELRKQILAHNALGGTAIIMDVETGEVRAVSNLTRYGNTVRDDVNYAITMRCEPGSTFKLVSLMALLEEAGYDINTPVDCSSDGKYYYQPRPNGRKYLVEDTHPVGKTNLMGVMEHSSNIGFVKLIDGEYRNEPQRFVGFINGLGINRVADMQLNGAMKPVIKDPSRPRETGWDAISLMKMSYGYAVELTPLHTLMLYNAVANGGTMVTPRLVTAVTENGKSVEKFGREVLNPEICSTRTLELVRQSLEGVVLRGTGSALKNETYLAAGKTGTAQMVVPGKVGYVDDKGGRYYMGSFVGYFPADKPKYSCIVAVKTYTAPGNRNPYYGAVLALPAFKAIADRVYALDENWLSPVNDRIAADTIPVKGGDMGEIYAATHKLDVETALGRRSSGWAITGQDSARVTVNRIDVDAQEGIMPSVMGMGLKDALYVLESRGLKVNFKGTGRVVAQSPKAGDGYAAGGMATLTLKPEEEKQKPARTARRR